MMRKIFLSWGGDGNNNNENKEEEDDNPAQNEEGEQTEGQADQKEAANADGDAHMAPAESVKDQASNDQSGLSADEIRRRRLARFGAAPSATPQPASATTSHPSPPKQEKPQPAPVSQPQPPQPVPTTSKVKPQSTPTPVSNPTATDTAKQQLSNLRITTGSPPKKAKMSPIPLDEWEENTLERIFQISLSQTGSGNQQTVYLESLAQELEAEFKGIEGNVAVSRGIIDRVLVERLSLASPNNSPPLVEYLLSCYRRILEETKKLKGKQPQRVEVLQNSAKLVVSYCGLVMLHPESFPQSKGPEGIGSVQLLPMLKANPGEDKALPEEFLAQLVERFEGEELTQLFTPIFYELSGRAKDISLIGSFLPTMRVLAQLTNYKQLATVFISLPNWIPANMNGRQMELASALGPFLRLTSCPDDPSVGEQYFLNPSTRTPAQIGENLEAIRMLLRAAQKGQYQLIFGLLKMSKEHRDAILSWIAAMLEKNTSRLKMNADWLNSSTDGFLLNLCSVLLQLCLPFLDSPAKADSIDSSYFVAHSRMDLSKETKLAATSDETSSWVDKRNPNRWRRQGSSQSGSSSSSTSATTTATTTTTTATTAATTTSTTTAGASPTQIDSKPIAPPNFITECFFITLRALHVGFLRSCVRFTQFAKAIHERQGQKKELTERQAQWANTPLAANNNRMLEQLNAQLELMTQQKLAMEAHLLDPEFLQTAMRFYLLVCTWITRLADPQRKGLPLVVPPPMAFATLPEHCVEDVADFVLYLARTNPRILEESAFLDDLMGFSVMMMASPDYVKNPYLRSKLVEVLVVLIPRHGQIQLQSLFNMHPVALQGLVPALMRLYVDIEFTGSHTQFYDKFNIRYYISELFKYLWTIPMYRISIREQSNDHQLFLRFVNMLINDSIYLLDECLSKLSEIRTTELLMDDAQQWERLPADQKKEKMEAFARNENMVKSFMLLANETVNMLHYLSAELVEPFMRSELVDRLANMLDYFLVQLAGPKCLDLKVKNPEKYHFDPRVLLGKLVDIFINFGVSPAFIQAVVNDGRSYSHELFTKALRIISDRSLRPSDVVAQFEVLIMKLHKSAEQQRQSEEDLGDVPDDFLDPIMSTLMRDPVRLPSSGVVVDRATITRHLLSDQSDPFNRNPLTMDQLVPDTELKAKIEAFIASKKK